MKGYISGWQKCSGSLGPGWIMFLIIFGSSDMGNYYVLAWEDPSTPQPVV